MKILSFFFNCKHAARHVTKCGWCKIHGVWSFSMMSMLHQRRRTIQFWKPCGTAAPCLINLTCRLEETTHPFQYLRPYLSHKVADSLDTHWFKMLQLPASSCNIQISISRKRDAGSCMSSSGGSFRIQMDQPMNSQTMKATMLPCQCFLDAEWYTHRVAP